LPLSTVERFRGNVGEGFSIVVSSVGALVRIATIRIKVSGTGGLLRLVGYPVLYVNGAEKSLRRSCYFSFIYI
jgi:hypothetical protein